jgi:hypothetical protein
MAIDEYRAGDGTIHASLFGDNTVLIRFRKAVRAWYKGKFVPYENKPGSAVTFLAWDYERHWTARTARVLIAFWLKYWQWIITVAVAPFIFKMLK